MACSPDYIDFVCAQLEGTGVVRAKKMFGDWCVYVDEKPIILACDNICYIKKLTVIEALMKEAECGFPYEGAREHYILDIDHRQQVHEVVKTMLPVLPYPKKTIR